MASRTDDQSPIYDDEILFVGQCDDNQSITTMAFGEGTTYTLRRVLQLGLAADELREYSTTEQRDRVRALANALGYSLEEIDSDLEYETESAASESAESDSSLLEEEWPYEYVEPGEVTQDLSYQEAKTLRQQLDALRSTVDEWACDECESRKSVVWNPASDQNRCRVCAGFEDPHDDTSDSEDTQDTQDSEAVDI